MRVINPLWCLLGALALTSSCTSEYYAQESTTKTLKETPYCFNPVEVTAEISEGEGMTDDLFIQTNINAFLLASELIINYAEEVHIVSAYPTYFRARLSESVLGEMKCDGRVESIKSANMFFPVDF